MNEWGPSPYTYSTLRGSLCHTFFHRFDGLDFDLPLLDGFKELEAEV